MRLHGHTRPLGQGIPKAAAACQEGCDPKRVSRLMEGAAFLPVEKRRTLWRLMHAHSVGIPRQRAGVQRLKAPCLHAGAARGGTVPSLQQDPRCVGPCDGSPVRAHVLSRPGCAPPWVQQPYSMAGILQVRPLESFVVHGQKSTNWKGTCSACCGERVYALQVA